MVDGKCRPEVWFWIILAAVVNLLHLWLLHPRLMYLQVQHTSSKEIKRVLYFNFLNCSFFYCCLNLSAKSPGIHAQQQEEVKLSKEESSSELGASNRTIQSSSSAAISVCSGSTSDDFVLIKLFESGQAYVSILQKIFLYLDAKSLKHCKLTCSQWKVFIDQEIWGVASARKVLQDKLMSNWKDEHFVEVSRINPGHRTSRFDCDEDVMVFCGDDGLASVYSSSTHEKLYTFTFPRVGYVSVGDDFLAFDLFNYEPSSSIRNPLVIIKKFTGQIEYLGQHVFALSHWWRMIGNGVVTADNSGTIHILSKDPETMKWTKQEQKSKIKLYSWGVCGDGDYLVIPDMKEVLHLWDWKNGTHTDKRVKCNDKVNQVEFINPFVFAWCGAYGQHIMKIFNIFTGDLVRQFSIGATFRIQIGQKFLSIIQIPIQKATVFDLKELTNKELENDQLWQRVFQARDSNSERSYANGASINTKMVVFSVGGKPVDIYDFWPDRDYEVTEDIGSEESEDNEDEDDSEESE